MEAAWTTGESSSKASLTFLLLAAQAFLDTGTTRAWGQSLRAWAVGIPDRTPKARTGIGRRRHDASARRGSSHEEVVLSPDAVRVLESGHLDVEHVAVHQENPFGGDAGFPASLRGSPWFHGHGGLPFNT